VTYPLADLLRTMLLLFAQGWRDQDDADALRLALLSNFGPGVLMDFGPPAVPQPTVSRSYRGAWHGQESQSGFVRAASPGA
jgi:hypothetical protein